MSTNTRNGRLLTILDLHGELPDRPRYQWQPRGHRALNGFRSRVASVGIPTGSAQS